MDIQNKFSFMKMLLITTHSLTLAVLLDGLISLVVLLLVPSPDKKKDWRAKLVAYSL